MEFSELVQFFKDSSSELLNSSMFSTDSIEGWICIFLLGFIIWNLWRKVMHFVSWSIAVIFLLQVFYWLSFTSLNNYIPLSDWFKYDVLTSIAQCFVGTKICDILLYINAWLKTLMFTVCNYIFDGGFADMLRNAGVNYPIP